MLFRSKVYPKDAESLNEKTAKRSIEKLIKRMYKSKGSGAIRNQLKTDEKDIFIIEKPDYK